MAKRPRFHVHFTPTYGSWLDLVERWFAELTNNNSAAECTAAWPGGWRLLLGRVEWAGIGQPAADVSPMLADAFF